MGDRAVPRPVLTPRARILAAVRRIPAGTVLSYGEVARRARLPGQARQVGWALAGLGESSDVPWWRVVNAAGRISLPPGSSAALTQRLRLEAEGVRVDAAGRVAPEARPRPARAR